MGKRKPKYPPFIMLQKEMVKSKAWEELSNSSMRAYIQLRLKDNGKNRDNLSLTYEEAKKFASSRTLKKNFDELVEHGFLDVVRSGRMWRKCNIFALSDRWRKYGKEEFVKGKRVVVGEFNPLALAKS